MARARFAYAATKRQALLLLVLAMGCGTSKKPEDPALSGEENANDMQVPACLPRLPLSSGFAHSCVLSTAGALRCWGNGNEGQLGYGNTDTIGDDDLPSSVGEVEVGGAVTQLALGAGHNCVLLAEGNVRCWGAGIGQYDTGALGYGNTNAIGDNETPASAGDVDVGGRVVQVAVGTYVSCALLETGNVRCWGWGGGTVVAGLLGYGNNQNIGDDETPASAGDVQIGGPVVQLAAGGRHICALLQDGNVRCWGSGDQGQLGYGNTQTIGDDEVPASAGNVDVGGPVKQVVAGEYYTCALLVSGEVRCWGQGGYGAATLGYALGAGSLNAYIGDDEVPASAGSVNIGGNVEQISAGSEFTCALLDTGNVRCWGLNNRGQLGYGNTTNIGGDEVPAAAGDLSLGMSLRLCSPL